MDMHRWELALLLIELGLLSGVGTSEQEAATRQWLERMDEDANGTIEWAELLAKRVAVSSALRLAVDAYGRLNSGEAFEAKAPITHRPVIADRS